MRGGERCLEAICELFPDAHLFTLIHRGGKASATIERMPITTSFLQKIPFAKSGYRRLLPLMPAAIESFDLSGYDLILSSSHCVAKGVMVPANSTHICYCYTPMRYAWDCYFDYFGRGRPRFAALYLTHYLRLWDTTSSARVDYFAAISKHIARRIMKYYRRPADVIYPPVDCSYFQPGADSGDFFLMVTAFSPYKRVDLAIDAFNELGHRLIIVGASFGISKFRRMARANIEFKGFVPDSALKEYYKRCRAFIFPHEEDFGIAPLEAMASGRPVIAYAGGGALETIVPINPDNAGPAKGEVDPTGVYFYKAEGQSLIEAVRFFEKVESEFDSSKIRARALAFDKNNFKANFKSYILSKYSAFVNSL